MTFALLVILATAIGAAASALGWRSRSSLVAIAAGGVVVVALAAVLTVAGLAPGAAWFCVCAIAFGGRVLRCGSVAEAAESAAARPATG